MTVLSKILTLAIIALCILSLDSCFSDSNSGSSTVDGNCAITRLTLGSIPRRVYAKTEAGTDTTYITNIAGSAYAMYIDQINQEIYNHDSLPKNTLVDKIVFSGCTSDGTVVIESKSGQDTIFSTSDTIDFSTPRYLTCYSTDGTQSKKYTVRVNVHNSQPEDFTWHQMTADNEAFSQITSQKMFVVNDQLTVLALKNNVPATLQTPRQEPGAWTTATITGLTSIDPAKVIVFDNKLCYVDNGTLKTSDNGIDWQSVGTDTQLTQLFAASETELYAVADGEIYCSANLTQWTKDEASDNTSLFPTTNITAAVSDMAFNSNFYNIIVCGTNATGETVVWKKIVDRQGTNTEPWTIYPAAQDNKNAYPAKQQAVVLNYDSKLYHMGLSTDGTASEICVSTDQGRCWLPQSSDNNPSLPEGITSFSASVDADNYIWIATAPKGTLHRGRINRLSYANDPTVFPKSIR